MLGLALSLQQPVVTGGSAAVDVWEWETGISMEWETGINIQLD